MSGIVEPDLEHLEDQVRRVFGERLMVPTLEGDDLYFLIDTRYQHVTGAEVARIAAVLDVGLDRIKFQDLAPDSIRFIVDVTPVTSPQTPAALEGRRP